MGAWWGALGIRRAAAANIAIQKIIEIPNHDDNRTMAMANPQQSLCPTRNWLTGRRVKTVEKHK